MIVFCFFLFSGSQSTRMVRSKIFWAYSSSGLATTPHHGMYCTLYTDSDGMFHPADIIFVLLHVITYTKKNN